MQNKFLCCSAILAPPPLFLIFLSLFFYFEREREKEHTSGEGAERERIPSTGSAEPDVGLKLMNCEIMT